MDKMKVFIVEDDPFYSEAIQATLEDKEFDLYRFSSVDACMKMQEVSPDILLLDFELESGKTGLDVLNWFKEKTGKDIPAVFLSGQKKVSKALKVLKSGAYDYLVKDEIDLQTLGEVLHKLSARIRLKSEQQKLRTIAKSKRNKLLAGAIVIIALFATLLLCTI